MRQGDWKAKDLKYQVTYAASQDVTNPGYDGRMIAFPVSYVSAEFVGAPEEKSKTLKDRIVVSIDGSTLAVWKLPENDLVRILFEYARRFLKNGLEKNSTFSSRTVRGPLVSISKEPGPCPFDPSRIPDPDGFSETIQIQKQMGFGAQ